MKSEVFLSQAKLVFRSVFCIAALVFYSIDFGPYLTDETSYLIHGNKTTGIIKNKSRISEKEFTYDIEVINSNKQEGNASFIVTKTLKNDLDPTQPLVIRYEKFGDPNISFGDFQLMGYLVILLLLLVGILISVISTIAAIKGISLKIER